MARTARTTAATTGKTVKNTVAETPAFIGEIEQMLKGNNTRQQAELLQQQMANALQSQIGLKEAATMDFQGDVKKAQANVRTALMNNGNEITSSKEREEAVANYLAAKDALVEAEEKLEHHLKTIEWLKEGQEVVNG